MGWKLGATLLFAGLIMMACGPRAMPSAQSSPAADPRTSGPTPTFTPQPEATPAVASINCSGGPGTAMVVIARTFVYDVADPINPRLVCRATDTVIHLIDGNAIAYTTVVANQVVIVRRDLTTGAESRIAQLLSNPNVTITAWTSDGSLEVYATAGAQSADWRWQEQIHLWSNGADHILYTYDAGPGGFAGRWSAHMILEFSPDHAYLAISDTNYSPQNYNVRIFSVTDLGEKIAIGTQGLAAAGGTWVANDRFVWAAGSGTLMQWTPAGGATVLRSERWFTPTSSSDGRWLAGTLLTDQSKPSVQIVQVGGGGTFKTGLGSSPGFVTPTVVWYAEEGPLANGGVAGDTWPNGVIRAFDLARGSDQVVHFRAGDAPVASGLVLCCAIHG